MTNFWRACPTVCVVGYLLSKTFFLNFSHFLAYRLSSLKTLQTWLMFVNRSDPGSHTNFRHFSSLYTLVTSSCQLPTFFHGLMCIMPCPTVCLAGYLLSFVFLLTRPNGTAGRAVNCLLPTVFVYCQLPTFFAWFGPLFFLVSHFFLFCKEHKYMALDHH